MRSNCYWAKTHTQADLALFQPVDSPTHNGFRICGAKPDPQISAGPVQFCFRRNKLLRLVLINKLINIRYKVE